MVGTLVGLVAALSAAAAEGPAKGPAALEVTVRARAIAPGEPLRVVVRPPGPLMSLSGKFLGRRIYFSRAGDAGTEWSGWAVVSLDDEPRPAVIDLEGKRADGEAIAGAHAVTIEARRFPTEKLTVEPKFVEPPKAVQARIERERKELAEIYASRRPAAPPAAPFVRPVPGEPTGVFGSRRVFNEQPRAPHSGVDLRAATGTPVLASGPGTVALAKDLYFSGLTVILDHGGGLFTLYAHLSRLDVEPGETVEAGAKVGLSGATGRVTGPHLHWGAKIGSEIFDPRALLDPALF